MDSLVGNQRHRNMFWESYSWPETGLTVRKFGWGQGSWGQEGGETYFSAVSVEQGSQGGCILVSTPSSKGKRSPDLSFTELGVVCLNKGRQQTLHEIVEEFLVGPIPVPLPKDLSPLGIPKPDKFLFLTNQATSLLNVASVYSKKVWIDVRSNKFDRATTSNSHCLHSHFVVLNSLVGKLF